MARTKKEKPVDWRDPTEFSNTLNPRIYQGIDAYRNTIKSPAMLATSGTFTQRAMGEYLEKHCLNGDVYAYVQQAKGIIQSARDAASKALAGTRVSGSWQDTLQSRMLTGQRIPAHFSSRAASVLIQFNVQSLVPALDFESTMDNFFSRYVGSETTSRFNVESLLDLRGLSLKRALTPRQSDESQAINDAWVKWAMEYDAANRRALDAQNFIGMAFAASETTLAAFRTFAGLRVVCEAFQIGPDRMELAQQPSRGARADRVDLMILRANRPQWAFDWEQHREVLMAMATARRLHPDATNYADTVVVIDEREEA